MLASALAAVSAPPAPGIGAVLRLRAARRVDSRFSSTPPAIVLTPRRSASSAFLREHLRRCARLDARAVDVGAARHGRVVDAPAAVEASLPPVIGSYTVERDAVVFKPQFGFDPGRRYRVVFDAGQAAERAGCPIQLLMSIVGLPRRNCVPTTVVTGVYPSGDVVPENQLRLYIHFSAPMGLKGGIGYVRLARRGWRRGTRSVPSARCGVLEPRPHAVHGVLRSRPPETRHPAERGDGPFARRRPLATRSSCRASGVMRRGCRSRRNSGGASRSGRRMNVRSTSTRGGSSRRARGGREPLAVTFPEPLDHGLPAARAGDCRQPRPPDRRRVRHRSARNALALHAGRRLAQRRLLPAGADDPRRHGRQPHRPRVRGRRVLAGGRVGGAGDCCCSIRVE